MAARHSLAPLSSMASSSSLASNSRASTPATARPSPRPPVSYVLLAEFDIDEGSLLKHSYPVSTGTDEHLLAEHMLPDGAHDRQEDWTVFYLNQIPALTVDSSLLDSLDNPERPEGSKERKLTPKMSAEQLLQKKEPRELLYVMSLVRTKKDASVRRGALVKALAVVSHSPYIQIYKPILLLALEDYYRSPSLSILQRLYSAINSMDLSGLPSLSRDERLVLRGSERKDLFEEKFWGTSSSSTNASPLPESHRQLRRTPSNSSIAGSSNAAEVLTASRDTTASSFDRQSLRSSDSRSSLRDPSASSSTEDLAWKARSRAGTVGSSELAASPLEGRSTTASSVFTGTSGGPGPSISGGGKPKDTHYFETKVHYAGIPLPIRIPVGTFEEEIGDYSLINLIQTFSPSAAAPQSTVSGPLHPHLHTSGLSTHPIILLLNAILTHKRVVFLGHQQAAGKVAELVLAACALGTGCGAVLGGVVQRAFPYTNLSNLDNLQEVPGFIAGVCNPAFLERPSWWDVLLNMETGRIIVSKTIEQPPNTSSSAEVSKGSTRGWSKTATGGVEGGATAGGRESSASVGVGGEEAKGAGEGTDAGFMEEVLSAIQSHYGEAVIRARITDYVFRFVRLASRYEEDGGLHSTTIGYPCAGYRTIQGVDKLGSGVVFADELVMTREMGAVTGRVEGWRGTKSYGLYQKTFEDLRSQSPLGDMDPAHQISRLRQGRRMPDGEVSLILGSLVDNTQTDEQVVAILAYLPSHFGGLLPLAFGLFHPQPSIRASTIELLDRLDSHPTGTRFVQSLNAFHKTAYHRLRRDQKGVVASPVSTKSFPPQVPPKEVY